MSGSYLSVDDNSSRVIGSHSSGDRNVLLGATGGEIVIGNDVLICPNVVSRAAEHALGRADIPIRFQRHRSDRIMFGDNVWIEANLVVTFGVSIGDGCVMGTESIVAHDLLPMTIFVSNPARPFDQGCHDQRGSL